MLLSERKATTTTKSSLAPSWKLFISILLRLVMTCFIIGEFVPLPLSNNNYIKTLYLFIAWGVSFQFDIRVYELCFCMCVNVLFIALNYNALSKGIFQFTSQDFLLQPVWEFFMWGFYVLHAMRSLGDHSCSSVRPKKREILIIGVSLLAFSSVFGIFDNMWVLSSMSCLVVFVCKCLLSMDDDNNTVSSSPHKDVKFVVFFMVMGLCIEWTGVSRGQWKYPQNQLIWEKFPIPLWFVGMWGGIGFFLYRAALPLMWWVVRLLQKPKNKPPQ